MIYAYFNYILLYYELKILFFTKNHKYIRIQFTDKNIPKENQMNFKKSALMLSFAAAMSLLNTTVFAIDMSKSEVIKTTGKVAVKKTTSPEFKKLNSNL